MKKEEEFAGDDVTFSRESTTSTMNEHFVKIEHDVSDALFEYTVKQSRECQHRTNVSSTKRKRIVGDNDNEDNKNTVCVYDEESCNKSVNSDITDDVDIGDVHFNEEYGHLKLEDAIKPEILMQDTVVLNGKDQYLDDDAYYYCCGCNQNIKNYALYLEHIISQHGRARIKHFDLKPDIHNDKLYCRACEKRYSSPVKYRMHLKQTHKIIPVLSEDQNSADFHYCCGCNKYIERHALYLLHIKYEHMRKKIKHYHLKPDVNDPNFYCKACERKYDSRIAFRAHIKKIHQIHEKPADIVIEEQHSGKVIEEQHSGKVIEEHQSDIVIEEQHSDIVIEEQHSGKVIEEQHSGKVIEEQHSDIVIEEQHSDIVIEEQHSGKVIEEQHSGKVIEEQHSDIVIEEQHSDIVIEEQHSGKVIEEQHLDNSPYYCCGCDTFITDYTVYQRHIQYEHGKKRIKHFHLKPDLNDPNLYCNACERIFGSKIAFRVHLRGSHQLDTTFSDRVIEEQPSDDHQHYCCGCDRRIKNNSIYQYHIEHHHKKTKIKHYHLKPDMNDPDFHCKSCERTFFSAKSFRGHLRFTHCISRTSQVASPDNGSQSNQSAPMPDPDCEHCQKTSSSHELYSDHTSQTHTSTPSDALPKTSNSATPVRADSSGVYFAEGMLLDDENRNNYCNKCERSYTSFEDYEKHLVRAHRSSLAPLATRKLDNRRLHLNEGEQSCQPCGKRFKTLAEYKSHLREFHKLITTRSRAKKISKFLPSVNSDAIISCSDCPKSFKFHSSYIRHLRFHHQLVLKRAEQSQNDVPHLGGSLVTQPAGIRQSPRHSKSMTKRNSKQVSPATSPNDSSRHTQMEQTKRPDPDNPNFKCTVCKFTFGTKTIFRKHCNDKHSMNLAPFPLKRNPAVVVRLPAKKIHLLPDPFDPEFYCRVCKTKRQVLYSHRRHCMMVHSMKLKPLQRLNVNPKAKIDMFNPSFYCAKCERSMSSKSYFKLHLRKFHNLKYPENK